MGNVQFHPVTGNVLFTSTGVAMDPACCCTPTCPCGGSIQVAFTGITVCTDCYTGWAGGKIQAAGTIPDFTVCLPQTGIADNSTTAPVAAGWVAHFFPAGLTASLYNNFDCSADDFNPYEVLDGIRVYVLWDGAVWTVRVQTPISAYRAPNEQQIPDGEFFSVTIPAASCTVAATGNNQWTGAGDCGGQAGTDRGIVIGYGGSVTITPNACVPADCNEEPLALGCPQCHGNTPHTYNFEFTVPAQHAPGAICWHTNGMAVNKCVRFDPTLLNGNFTLTRGAGNSCVWTGSTVAIDWEYIDCDQCGLPIGSGTVVNQVATITLTRGVGTWTLTVFSADGIVDLFYGQSQANFALNFISAMGCGCGDLVARDGNPATEGGPNDDPSGLYAEVYRCDEEPI